MSMMGVPTLNPLVSIAKTWLGTPYKHQHSVKGAGCDCLGLVRGIYREHYGYSPEEAPPYSPSWAEAGDDEILIQAAERHLRPLEELEDGCVIIFRMKPTSIAKHCGIYLEGGKMIHAVSGRTVEEIHLNDFWYKRIAGIYSMESLDG